MKTLKITVNGKTYSSGKITAWHAREGIAIQKQALALDVARAEIMQAADKAQAANEILSKLTELADRKANLICEVYGGKFTFDELERSLTGEEIELQIAFIIGGIQEVIEKN